MRLVALLLASLAMVAGAVSAAADVPRAPAAAFNATCPGSTDSDPAIAAGPISDLTRVSDRRLARYNAGQTVVLYDARGTNSPISTPALCSLRYDSSSGGPVTEWRFCLGVSFHGCELRSAVGANPQLTADQDRIIASLIDHGHSYQPSTGYLFGGVTQAISAGSTEQRRALQHLVWCISEPTLLGDPAFVTLCAVNLPAAEQQRILGNPPVRPPPAAAPRLTLTLRTPEVIDVNRDGVTDAGDQIDYDFLLVNRGNVTLTGLGIDDPLLGAVLCDAMTVAPGRSVRCHPARRLHRQRC